ncbi:LLM class flavin-dependent oxidoreductase [Microbacterium sp.]|uniref:LLM class flavin-dependent oxidoreductase n=1 Tax=Microbacterium sp. TaxID=51671 RepID=UPI0039E715B7
MSAEPRTDPVPSTAEPHDRSGIGRRLRVGFITHLDQHDDPAGILRDNVALIRALEDLGYDSAWIATRHFHSGWAGLPSPFAFLGAVAQATSRIHLGTAVLPLLVDDPIRDAEEVAVLDLLSGGRLQLGLGKGVPSDAYHVFERWAGQREAEFDAKVDQLLWGLGAPAIPDSRSSLWPRAQELLGRIYIGTSNRDTIRRAARTGVGLVLERFGNTPFENSPEGRQSLLRRQADSLLDYRSEFRRTWGQTRSPYAVVSRSVWPGTAEEGAAVNARWYDYAAQFSRAVPGRSPQDALLADNIVWGEPAELAAHLLADPAVTLSDELLLGIHPAHVSIEETVARARILVEEVVPLVTEGWLAARGDLEARVDGWELEAVTR